MFDVLFSEKLALQRNNIATVVLIATNLNWRPPGVQKVRISCVPTVTGTVPDVHPGNSTS